MDDDQKPRPDEPRESARDPDIFLVILEIADEAELAAVVRDLGIDIDHRRPRKSKGGRMVATEAFVTQSQISDLENRGWKLDVRENLSDLGRKRQAEVGRGDRFESGKISPKGLGKKLRKGD